MNDPENEDSDVGEGDMDFDDKDDSGMSGSDWNSDSENESITFDDSSELDLDSEGEEDNNDYDEAWMDQCQFQCHLCKSSKNKSLEFNNVQTFESHAQKVHGKTYAQFKKTYRDPCSLLRLTSCLICNDVLVYERDSLIEHLTSRHSINHQVYFKRYVQK